MEIVNKKKNIYLILAIEIIALITIISAMLGEIIIYHSDITSESDNNSERTEVFNESDYVSSEIQENLCESNYDAAMKLQEMVINSQNAWYDEDDNKWRRKCTIYTDKNVDESFLKEALGTDRERLYLFMENYTGIVDYFIFGFIDNYSFYESELYEGSNIKVWKITVRSEVSPEDQQLICDTAQEIAGKAVGSDAEKVRIITKEIDDIISYEEIEGNNLATVIKTGKGCCRHYADLFYLACNYAGIDSRIVVGNCESEGDHAWNIVEVDDKWYHVDPTWEDDESGNWVLLGSNTIKETRSLYLNYEEFNEFYDISEEDYAA